MSVGSGTTDTETQTKDEDGVGHYGDDIGDGHFEKRDDNSEKMRLQR